MITLDTTTNTIKIIDGSYDFNDVYEILANTGKVKKIDNLYFIDANIQLGDGSAETEIISKNESIIVTGQLFQIYENATLQLGEIDYSTYATKNGSTLMMPNIKLAYGFGCNQIINGNSKSGNLKVYGSTIKAWGFWAFFNGDRQIIEIVNSNILGFGRVSGYNSIIYNNIFEKSHGRYGVLGLKGKIKLYEKNQSLAVEPYNNIKSSLYFNPKYSPGMVVKGWVLRGYDYLVYAEPDPNYNGTIQSSGIAEIIDCDIDKSNVYFTDESTKVIVKYEHTFQVVDENDNLIPFAQIDLYDNDGNYVDSYFTNNNGFVVIPLVKYELTKTSTKEFQYYKLVAKKDDLNGEVIKVPEKGKTIIKIDKQCTESSGSSVSNDKLDQIINMIQDLKAMYEQKEYEELKKIDDTSMYIKTKMGWKVFI